MHKCHLNNTIILTVFALSEYHRGVLAEEMEELIIKKLLLQIVKFGIVGVICFLIDYSVTVILNSKFDVYYLIAKFWGFVVSVIANYLLSLKFVFARTNEMDRKKEFLFYITLSAFGLVINEIVMYIYVEVVYTKISFIHSMIPAQYVVSSGVVIATGVVMIYNFISRKLLLERKA